jgi:hypothetical protein
MLPAGLVVIEMTSSLPRSHTQGFHNRKFSIACMLHERLPDTARFVFWAFIKCQIWPLTLGMVLVLQQTLHGAIQFAAYEELKHFAASTAVPEGASARDLNSLEVSAYGATSKMVAAISTYPTQVRERWGATQLSQDQQFRAEMGFWFGLLLDPCPCPCPWPCPCPDFYVTRCRPGSSQLPSYFPGTAVVFMEPWKPCSILSPPYMLITLVASGSFLQCWMWVAIWKHVNQHGPSLTIRLALTYPLPAYTIAGDPIASTATPGRA